MSTSVDTAFVRQYEREVKEAFQRSGSYLLQTLRRVNNVKGSSTTFQVIGAGIATTKSRHGTITPMNQSHTAVQVILADFYAGDWIDKLDETKINHDERLAIAHGGAMALGRKADDQIITQLNATTQTQIAVTLTASGNAIAGLIEMVEGLDSNDVPNDGQRYGCLTPRVWSIAMINQAFSSADYVTAGGRPFITGAPTDGRFKEWMNVKWFVHPNLPGVGTATANIYVYHKTAVGYAMGADITADVTWHGDRAAHFVNHWMSGQAGLIDDPGVIEGQGDDTTSIPTS